MKEKKHWNRRVLSFFLALAMVITQLGVWNAGKESVQAADTVIYQENFSESTDGWTPEWSVGSDLTTFAVGKNYAKDNDSSLNIWSKKAQVLTITHEVSAVEEGNYYVSLNTYGGSVNSGTISISDGTTEQSADIGRPALVLLHRSIPSLRLCPHRCSRQLSGSCHSPCPECR